MNFQRAIIDERIGSNILAMRFGYTGNILTRITEIPNRTGLLQANAKEWPLQTAFEASIVSSASPGLTLQPLKNTSIIFQRLSIESKRCGNLIFQEEFSYVRNSWSEHKKEFTIIR